jgi:hypothetical protein
MGSEQDASRSGFQALSIAGPDDLRLRFSGPPHHLTGAIPLINTGSDRGRIRQLAVHTESLMGPARMPLREIPFWARLDAGQQASVDTTISIDPRTPPGTYDFELTIGNRTVPATAHVTEVVDLRVDPLSVTILAGAASSYTRTFIVENAGNVPLPGGAECEAPLFETIDMVSALIAGLHKSDRKSASSMTRAFLNEWADLQVGTVLVKRNPITLRPGQKIPVDIEFVLSADLQPLHHYRTGLYIYNAMVSLDIYTTAKAGSGRESDQPAQSQ